MFICRLVKTILWVTLIISLLFACSKEEITDVQYFERAKTFYAQNNVRASIIELKNTLQRNPKHIEARLLLGKLYLHEKDGVSAEKELMRAKNLGSTEPQINLYIIQSMRLQSKFRKITELYPLDNIEITSGNAKFAALVGEAYLMSADLAKGESLIKKSYAVMPDDANVKLSFVKLKIEKSQVNQAEMLLEELLIASPKFNEAWLIRGNIYFLKGKYSDARQAYQNVIGAEKNSRMTLPLFSAYVGVIRSLLALQELAAVEQVILKLEELSPKHPMAIYYHGLLAYELKNYDLAKEKLQIVVRELPDYLPSYLLLGTIHFIGGNYEQADAYLTRYVNSIPTHVQARKILAATRMQQHRPDEAIEILQPVVDATDASLLAMIGQAAIASGDLSAANQYMKRALKIDSPQSSSIRAELARIYLAQGDYDQAIVELNELTKLHPKKAKFMLASAFIQQKNYSKAVLIAEELEKAFPNDPMVYFLLARVTMINNKKGEAREYFYQAIELKKDFVPAYLALAKMEMEEGDLLKAAANFDNVLLYDQINEQAMLGLAQLAERKGDVEQSLAWLKKASEKGRNKLLPHILLTRYYLSIGDLERASELAEESVKTQNNDYRSLQLLASVQVSKQRFNQAVETLLQVIKQRPKDANAYLRLARVQVIAKDYPGALDSINKSLDISPDSINALVMLADIESKRGGFKKMLEIGSKLEKESESSSIGFVIQGAAYLKLGDFKKAVLKYKDAYKRQQSGSIALGYSKALFASGKKMSSLQPLEEWLQKNPNDVKMQIVLGTAYQSTGMPDKAINMLEDVLQVQSENAVVLNNLSWMYFQKNDPRALQYAEKAHRLRPEIGAITDTFGWLLVQKGSIDKGVEVLKRAAEQSKGVPEIQYHLAVAYEKQGQIEKSRDLLKKVLSGGVQFNDKKEARALLDKIN